MRKAMMFYQDGNGIDGTIYGPRLRIIFPDGKVQFIFLYDLNLDHASFSYPCWAKNRKYTKLGDYGKFKSQKQAIREMKKFDKKEKQKAEFIGYI